jgi:altronate hydrolase
MSLIQLHANDNVWIAKEALAIGAVAEGIRIRAQVPAGHKIAARDIAEGETIFKYNTAIGVAARDIAAGEHVHGHNIGVGDFHQDAQRLAFGADVRPVDYVQEANQAQFMGYVRPDGRVGTRNFIGLFSSVNCSATVIHKIAAHFTKERLKNYPHIDGVSAFAQTTGCGMASPSPHFDLLRRTIAGYARHANVGGALVVGLGCERNQVADLMESQNLGSTRLMRSMVMQDSGGTTASIRAGIEAVEAMLDEVNLARRTPVSASHISIGYAMVVRRSCRKPPKYMAWSTCSHAARLRPLWVSNCSIDSLGGRSTPRVPTCNLMAWWGMAIKPEALPTSSKNHSAQP